MYLCGCVLFFLLLQTVKPNESARSHRSGNHDAHSDPMVMKDLIYTFTGSSNFGAAKDTSQYKEGRIEGTVNLPFNNKIKIAAFEDLICKNYSLALTRMADFTNKHFDRNLSKWFVGAVLEIVQRDHSIRNDQLFYVSENGSPLTKERLLKQKNFELEPFLVGILFFVLTERQGKNSQGIPTLNQLGVKKNRKPRQFESDIGEKFVHNIRVISWEKSNSPNDEEKKAQNKKASADESEEAHTLKESNEFKQNGKFKEEHTKINNQTMVIQNGDRNINVTNNGTINLDL
jgi:hypothetical protein